MSEVSVITVPSREGRGFNPAAARHPLTPSPSPPFGERVAEGRVRGAYGGAEAPPFRDADVTPIYVTKHWRTTPPSPADGLGNSSMRTSRIESKNAAFAGESRLSRTLPSALGSC